MRRIDIEPDIRKAATMPAEVYRDPRYYDAQRDRVFARSWQLVAPGPNPAGESRATPFVLLPGCLDEPLLLTRDVAGVERCLSNVCTHRGNLVLREARACSGLRCGYHGRRFGMDGRLQSMPEFEGVQHFPSKSDHLAALPLERWGPLAFTTLDERESFERWIGPVRRRVDWLLDGPWEPDEDAGRQYQIEANWALYCDNYLEGFHIPYVHEELNAVLDFDSYRTELFELASLQTGFARGDDAVFELPPDHPDAGRPVAGYYFFLFPNLMLNFYPWGLSVNVVEPRGVGRTVVRYLAWVRDPSVRQQGAGGDLEKVELEDQAVVEGCQRGVRSRLYRRGRYSARREAGVHHFHRLLADRLTG
jgi:choline monooxygenase